MRDALLNLVKTYTAEKTGMMTLSRLGPDSFPDPAKTSWNDMVQWRVYLDFGRGYFQGALVTWAGTWTSGTEYARLQNPMPLEEAVGAFLSNVIPEVQS